MSLPILIAIGLVALVLVLLATSGGTRVTIVHHDSSNDEHKEQ